LPDNVSMQFHETGNVSFIAVGAVTGKTFVSPSADRGDDGQIKLA
jgi:hypothetical protein